MGAYLVSQYSGDRGAPEKSERTERNDRQEKADKNDKNEKNERTPVSSQRN